jgi:uroporphyrinogen-III decarboxylase
MNSKERVKAALTFKNPDKVPVFNALSGDVYPLLITHSDSWNPGWNDGEEGLFPHLRTGYEKWKRPDWAKNNPDYEGKNWKKIPHEEIDEFGCIWNMKGNDKNMGHPGRASLLSWDDFDEYLLKYTPDASDKSRYNVAKRMIEILNEEKYTILIYNCMGPSQVLGAMRGFDHYLIDHRRHPTELKKALKVVADYHIDVLKYSKKYGIDPDGIVIVDDLGEQTGPFFSPKTFENFYEESYRTIIDGAHDLGVDVHHHCCGKIDPLLEPLIKWGLDAIELDSPRMSGYPDLNRYRGRIMFWGCVNIQSIYTLGTPEEVEREVFHMVRNLGTKNGGFGAYFYPQPEDIRVPRKNIKAFARGLQKYGDYSKFPSHLWESPVSKDWDDNIVPPIPK